MIVFLTLAYLAVLFVLTKMKILPNTATTWLSTIVWIVALFLFLFFPMQWGAPSGPVTILTRAVQIVPNVSGQVTEINVEANVPVKKGHLLFQIDPEPFEIAVSLAKATKARTEAQVLQDQDSLASAEAQFRQAMARRVLAQQRYDDDKKLVASGTLSASRLEQRQSDLDAAIGAVDQAQSTVSRALTEIGAVTEHGTVAKLAEANANLDQAEWNLEQTSVLAPSDGFVTNLALAVGQRVTSLPLAPAMVFIDTAEKGLVTNIQQIHVRY
ncbi:MAG: HlyD family secretion protein, partial [Boseongicola sp.]